MSQDQMLSVLKEIVVEMSEKSNPTHAKEISKLRSIVDSKITPDSPLSALGWDSLQMTMLLVAVEERLGIDTSNVSLFDLYTIGDFLSELQTLVDKKKA